MSQTQVMSIVSLLETVRQRPNIFLGLDNTDHRSVFYFLVGLNNACALFGLQYDENVWRDVIIERGWEYTGKHPIIQMVEKDKERNYIIDEILNIEIAAWKRTYDT